MPPLLQLQKLPGKGDGGWEKSVLHCFLANQKIVTLRKKMRFGASYSTSNKLFLVARHILTTGVGSVKFANSLSPPSIVKKVCTEVKAAKGLKQCQAKVKGVNNPA